MTQDPPLKGVPSPPPPVSGVQGITSKLLAAGHGHQGFGDRLGVERALRHKGPYEGFDTYRKAQSSEK